MHDGEINPYYAVSNPGFVALAKRTVEEILADLSGCSAGRGSGP
jgi:hypothetical protein